MAQDPVSGSDSVKTAIITKIQNDIAELFASVTAITVAGVAYDILAKTAAYTMTPSNLGGLTVVTNKGATGTVNLTLPAGVAGYRFTMAVMAAYALKATTNGSETIRHRGSQTSAGGYVSSSNIGDVWTLAWNDTEWIVEKLAGTLSHATGTFSGGGDPLQAEAFIY